METATADLIHAWRLGVRVRVGLAQPSWADPLVHLRLIQLAGGPPVFPADHRFDIFPVALVLHLVGSALFAFVGALQFVPRFRRLHRGWHRRDHPSIKIDRRP